MLGGKLSEIPKPHRRLFDDKRRKRKLKISVQVFYGIGRHYHVTVRQEDNPIWNPLTQAQASPSWREVQNMDYGKEIVGWQLAWDDEDGHGKSVLDKFDTLTQAKNFIKKAVKRFPNHKVVWNTDTETNLVYKSMGD